MGKSELVRELAIIMRVRGLPEPVEEVEFHQARGNEEARRWRFDFAWPEERVACEVEGGTWGAKSRHTTGSGYAGDCLKYSMAAIQGWIVVRCDGKMVKNGTAAALVARALEAGRLSVEARSLQRGY